jgi:hypothetical protein
MPFGFDTQSVLFGAMATCALFLFCDFVLSPILYIVFGVGEDY